MERKRLLSMITMPEIWSMHCAGLYHAQGGDILDITTEDFFISFRAARDGLPAGNRHLIGKLDSINGIGYSLFISAAGDLQLRTDDDTNDGRFSYDITALLDSRWHHYAFFCDRSAIATSKIWVDGIPVSPNTVGTNPVNTLTNATPFRIGARDFGLNIYDGNIRDVRIQIGGTMPTNAQVLAQATNPFLLDNTTWTLDGTREAWKLSAGSGLNVPARIDSPANDLTLNDVAGWGLSEQI